MRLGYKTIGLLALVGLLNSDLSAEAETMSRNRERFCNAWQFNLGDVPGAEAPNFNDSAWRTLDVPHDWSIELPFDSKVPGGGSVGYLPGGIGWYRKAFTVPESDRGKKVVIDFDGVYMDSQVWINGQLLGRRPNGYISFRYDLTPHLKQGGEENVIAVRANVEPNFSRWYPGAGIYRRVWLTKMNPVHVAHWGTYVTTHALSKEEASVRLKTDLENNRSEESSVTLNSVIMDSQGQEVASAESSQRIAGGAKYTFDQSFTVDQPALWSPDMPHLYEIVSTVKVAGKIVDEFTTPLGIRTVEFTKDYGFFLNGEHVDIKGVCLHHDFGPIGTAFYPRALERQLEILGGMGCNAIRTAHNPRDPEFYSICDRMGFMVMDEAFDVWEQRKLPNDYSQFFGEWHERDLTSMIRRDRNHPSIIIWSIGNEMNEQHREDFPGQGGVITTRLVEIVKQHDPSRAITSACNSYKASVEKGMVEPLDVYGQNYGMTQYPEIRKGGKPVIGTENATSFNTRGSYSFDMVKDRGIKLKINNVKNDSECTAYGKFWGDDRTEGTLVEMRKNPWVAGQFAWTGFDYLGECFPFGWPARHGQFGIVDMVGFPKESYYVYKSDWTDEPNVYLFPQNWNWTQYNRLAIPVWVFSNCEEVELFHNNKSLGVKTIDRDQSLHAEWDVKYRAGELKAVGLKDGKPVSTNIVRTAETPARLELSADRAEIAADGTDLSFVEVRLVDENGVLCPDSDRMIQVELVGEGTLLGIGNGNAFNHEPFTGNQVKTFHGLCRVIVKSTKQAGAIQLKITADGVAAGNISITTLPAASPQLSKAVAEKEARVREQNLKYSRHRIALVRRTGILNSGLKATASSAQPGYLPEHAIDGNPSTRWCPANGNSGHSWQVDLGGPRELKGAKIIWQTANAYQYIVEGSVDENNWVMLSDQSKKQDAQQEHNLALNQKGIRYVRITTTGLPGGLWGTFSEVEITGVLAEEIQQPTASAAKVLMTGEMTVAPVFEHGSGLHVDSVIVSRNKKPPTWSEAAARDVVLDELKRQGLEFTTQGEMPRIGGILSTRDGNVAENDGNQTEPIILTFDGVSKKGKIAFEVLTTDDIPTITDNTDHILNILGAAKKLVAELETKSGGYTVGVFYDPMEGKGDVPNDEPLRMQVRDFVEWLRENNLTD
jgi:beta-galactosidase